VEELPPRYYVEIGRYWWKAETQVGFELGRYWAERTNVVRNE